MHTLIEVFHTSASRDYIKWVLPESERNMSPDTQSSFLLLPGTP